MKIRCYEAKFSRKLNKNFQKLLKLVWFDKNNTYGIDLKKYIIYSTDLDYFYLGLYIKNENIFGNSILVDKYFSESCRNNYYFPNKVFKRRIVKFYPIDYHISEKNVSPPTKLVTVKGLFNENINTLGMIYGDCIQYGHNKKFFKTILDNIWDSKINYNYELIKPIRSIEL